MIAKDIAIDEFYDDVHPNPSIWEPLIKEACVKSKVAALSIRPFADGVNLVALVNDSIVVKVFPHFHRHQWMSDSKALEYLQGRLSISIPRFIAAGELSNMWGFLTMSKVGGVTLESVWHTLAQTHKIRILHAIGQIMAEVHNTPVGTLQNLAPPWQDFVAKQIHQARSRHCSKNMPDWFVDGVEDWIAAHLHLISDDSRRVILTGEYTPFNLLATAAGDDYELSGMIDFGDAMVGLPEYDLLGPSLFLAAGDRELVDALFEGYGIHSIDIDLQSRLLLLQILHRYSDFKAQLRRPDGLGQVKSFKDLANFIWPI